MTSYSVGDLSQSLLFRRQNLTLKSDVQRLSQEMTTGRASDVAARVKGDVKPLASIENALAKNAGYAALTGELQRSAGAMQSALSSVASLSSGLASSLIGTATSAVPSQIASLGADARNRFETVVALLNTRLGDRSLFAGVASNSVALADADVMLTALQAATSGAASAQDVETTLDQWFGPLGGFETMGFSGGVALAAVEIAPGESARQDVTASDPAIRSTLKGLAMAALLDRGVLSGNASGRQDLARRAGLSLVASADERVYLQGHLGRHEAQVSAAETRNQAEASSLEIARSNILAVDPYETASRLEATQTRLETIYALTARMSRLNLVDFLR